MNLNEQAMPEHLVKIYRARQRRRAALPFCPLLALVLTVASMSFVFSDHPSLFRVTMELTSLAMLFLGLLLSLTLHQREPRAYVMGQFSFLYKTSGLPATFVAAIAATSISLLHASHQVTTTTKWVSIGVDCIASMAAVASYLSGEGVGFQDFTFTSDDLGSSASVAEPIPEGRHLERIESTIESSATPPEIDPSLSQRIAIERVIADIFMSDRKRLNEEIQGLTRRGNLNLSIGGVISVMGIGLLLYLVTRPHDPLKGYLDALTLYLPRLTTVALVETFAYFFLQLYRRNLEDIKYYQNELTTLGAK